MPTKTRLLSPSKSAIPNLVLFNQYDKKRYPFLLASSASKKNNTQYDILFAYPQYDLTLNADKSLSCSDEALVPAENFFDSLEKFYQDNKVESGANKSGANKNSTNSSQLPFTGGWFVYLSYEMAEEVEPSLSLPASTTAQPLAVAMYCPAAIIYDKNNKQCFAVAEQEYEYLLDDLEKDYQTIIDQQLDDEPSINKIALDEITEADAGPYLKQVEKIKQFIVEGDIFQANLSRLWQVTLKNDVTDFDLFKVLSKHNPSSFAAMACLQDMTIISSSPERLVSLREGIVETRPIAGTRPRDKNKQNDKDLAKELLDHPKEQAEHIMLIDLERNDLGRVCRPGTIEVDELMVLESWEHVHHIVSNVRGELEKDKSPIDVLRAVFPGGTITGCPKVRCMEILAELEQQPRGAYTGSLGYINKDGSMDFNILIRTMVRHNKELSFRAGGGIVSDSIAENELEETRAKAKGLLKIFQLDNE